MKIAFGKGYENNIRLDFMNSNKIKVLTFGTIILCRLEGLFFIFPIAKLFDKNS